MAAELRQATRSRKVAVLASRILDQGQHQAGKTNWKYLHFLLYKPRQYLSLQQMFHHTNLWSYLRAIYVDRKVQKKYAQKKTHPQKSTFHPYLVLLYHLRKF